MSFVLGNTLHTTAEGHLVEFDADGSIIGTVDAASLPLAARSAFSQYQQVYRESQLALPQPGDVRGVGEADEIISHTVATRESYQSLGSSR